MTPKTSALNASDLRLRPASSLRMEELADLLNQCFTGYFVKIHDTADLLAQRLRLDSIDLALSRVAFLREEPIGLIYLSPRGWSCRVAGMGVVPEYRRYGIGRRLMDEAITLVRQRQFRYLLLEVIEQNTGAYVLYRDLCFVTVRHLFGYQFDDAPHADFGGQPAGFRDIDPLEIAQLVRTEGDPDLPWQLEPETLAAFTPPAVALALEDTAFALLSSVDASTAVVQALLVRRSERRQGWGLRLIEGLRRRYPGRLWKIPARVPEDLADDFLLAVGFERLDIRQFEMRLDL